MPEQTYLRVRRRRNAVAALKIQLDGIVFEPDDDNDKDGPTRPRTPLLGDPGRDHGTAADTLSHHLSRGRRPAKRSKKAVWRRVSVSDSEFAGHSHHANRKRNFRVVDAILHDDHVDNIEDEVSNHKRRRLTLIQTRTDVDAPWGRPSSNENLAVSNSSMNRRTGRQPYKILLPIERIVDDSLKQVFVGQRLVAEHYDLCGTDPRLADRRDNWLAYRNDEHGNLLHACALWNDVAVATELALSHRVDGNDRRSDRDGLANLMESMLYARDGEGRTPLQVAELCGNDAVVSVLREATGDYGDDDDDASFAYDIYCLDGEVSIMNDAPEDDGAGGDADSTPLDCELEGGVGYWDENGQLVLDMLPPRTMSEVSVADEDEFDDPNHEGWDGNDYPEDDYDDDGAIHSDGEDDDDDFYFERASMRRGHGMESDDEGNFDAAYGIYGHQDDDDALYAYHYDDGASTGSN